MPRPPHRGPKPPAPIRTPLTVRGSGAATCPGGTGAGSCASLLLEDSPVHRIQCGWLRRALPPRHAGQPLTGLTVHRVLPRYTVQPPAMHPTQSPSAALIGYDGTTLFHHAAYAASYTARSVTLQALPQATPGAVSTRQRMGMLVGRFPRAGKEIQE